jgi:hypothetical protein
VLTLRYDCAGHDVISKIKCTKRKMHYISRNFYQSQWWNDEVELSWLEKRRAVREWQKARENGTISPDHILLLKQVVDEKYILLNYTVQTAK